MVAYTVSFFQKPDSYGEYSSFVLGADVGGTHIKIGIAGVKHENPVLLFSINFKSKDITDPHLIFMESLAYAKREFNISVCCGCIGAAGVISEDSEKARLTNLPWTIDCRIIREQIELSDLFVINDFQIMGYGINTVNPMNTNDVLSIKPGAKDSLRSPRIVIGAGTGLGKCLLIFDEVRNRYAPLASEGGHADLPIYSSVEQDLVVFIQQRYGQSFPVTYEQVLSGEGLMNIYRFLSTQQTGHQDLLIQTPEDISKYRNDDMLCKKTFELFMNFYARCIKNYVLDTMALGGVFIAGGIAIKNSDLFQSSDFIDEMNNVFQRNDILRQVPVYLIRNPHVSLQGACLAAIEKKLK